MEIAAAAVASGRRPDLQAADQALAQAQARYDQAIRARTDALERARGQRAALTEQRGNIAETEYRSKDAAQFYLAPARIRRPATWKRGPPLRDGGRRCSAHGKNFFDNDALRESIRLIGARRCALRPIAPASDEQSRRSFRVTAHVLAAAADAQTNWVAGSPVSTARKMMVDARPPTAKRSTA